MHKEWINQKENKITWGHSFNVTLHLDEKNGLTLKLSRQSFSYQETKKIDIVILAQLLLRKIKIFVCIYICL